MKKIILITIGIFLFASCGPKRLGCGPKRLCDVNEKVDSQSKPKVVKI